MRSPCSGSIDRSPPKEIMWTTVPHRLFFGRDHTQTWGHGGAVFLHPESSTKDAAHICMYKSTLEQFNDVLLQENISRYDMTSPSFDEEAVTNIRNQHSVCLEVLWPGWYHDVVYLGEEQGIPILTMTYELADVESFSFEKLPLLAPGKAYANALIRGPVEGKQLSETEATAYVAEVAAKQLKGLTTVSLERVCEEYGGRIDLAEAYYKAITAFVMKYIKGNGTIASMELCNDFVFLGTEAISLDGVGNDFWCANFPGKPDDIFWLQGYLMVQGVYNSLWLGNYKYPDGNMIQSTHPCGEFNCQGGGWCVKTIVPLHQTIFLFNLEDKVILKEMAMLRTRYPFPNYPFPGPIYVY